MLVTFSVSNYKSFKNKITFSMKSTSIKKYENNIFCHNSIKFIKAAAIYGYNESGKSNLLSAINKMRDIILNSTREEPDYSLDINKFLLDNDCIKEPTCFKISFILDSILYNYEFKTSDNIIIYESLSSKKERTVNLFERFSNSTVIISNKESEWRKYADLTGSNTLLLSRMANLGNLFAKDIRDWFLNLKIIYGQNSMNLNSVEYVSSSTENKDKVVNFLKKMSIQIQDIEIKERDINLEELYKVFKKQFVKESLIDNYAKNKMQEIRTVHNKYSKGILVGNESFNLSQESTGTNKLFDLAAPIIDVLEKGGILFIDEFDTKLHPLIINSLFKLFNEGNTNKSQFIIISHLPQLLTWDIRYDQIWIMKKNKYEESTLSRANDLPNLRYDKNLMNAFVDKEFIL